MKCKKTSFMIGLIVGVIVTVNLFVILIYNGINYNGICKMNYDLGDKVLGINVAIEDLYKKNILAIESIDKIEAYISGFKSRYDKNENFLKAIKSADFIQVKNSILGSIDLNFVDISGWTPLHYAAYYGDYKICALLISNGADTNVKDRNGKKAIDLAVANGYGHVVELFSIW